MFGPNIETFSFTVPEIYNEKGEPLEVARHPEETIKFKLDHKVYPNDIMRIDFLSWYCYHETKERKK